MSSRPASEVPMPSRTLMASLALLVRFLFADAGDPGGQELA
jgi:hypothetical protein